MIELGKYMNTRDLLFLLKKEAEEILMENFSRRDTGTAQDIYPPGIVMLNGIKITNKGDKYWQILLYFKI